MRFGGNRYLNHPDHRAAGDACLDAVYPSARDPHVFPELLIDNFLPHKVREVWLYFSASQHVNHWVDISDTIEQKIQALAAHVSQIGEWARSGGLRREILKWASETATQHNLGYEYTEGFQRIVLVRDEEHSEASA